MQRLLVNVLVGLGILGVSVLLSPESLAWADGLVPQALDAGSPEDSQERAGDGEDDCEDAPPANADGGVSSGSDAQSSNSADATANVADPIWVYDGRLRYAETDLVVNGLFPITITRRYDSTSTYDSNLGYGWALNHDRRLYEYPDNSVVIRFGCGAKERHVNTTSISGGTTPYAWGNVFASNPVSRQSRKGNLKSYPDGSYEYRRQYGTVEFYDAQGRLTKITNRYGHSHVYTYDQDGKLPLEGASPFALTPNTPMTVAYSYQLERIAEIAADGAATGNYVDFTYDPSTGRLVTATSNDGRVVTYVHETASNGKNGNLKQVNGLEGRVSKYLYEDSNSSKRITSIQRNGETPWVSTYDSEGRVKTQTHGDDLFTIDYIIDFVETHVTRTITDAANANPVDVLTKYYFDANADVAEVIDASNNQVIYTRDPQGNMIRKDFFESADGSENRTQIRRVDFTYDGNGRRTSQTVFLNGFANGNGAYISRTWEYDNGWLSRQTVADSRDPAKLFETKYTFVRDGNNIPTNIQSIQRRKDDGSYQTTSFIYDAKNRVTSTTLADLQVIKHVYEGGSLYVNRLYYEVGGTESAKGRQRFSYDVKGNLQYSYDGKDNQTSYEFDDLNRMTSMTNAMGEKAIYTYSGNRVTQVEIGQTVLDGEGQVSRLRYTAEGFLEFLDEKDDAGAWKTAATMTYDSAGQRLSSADAQGQTTRFAYDKLGRVASVSDPLLKASSFGYDMFGNRTSITDANSKLTVVQYDSENRPVSVEQRGEVPYAVSVFSYDAQGNVTSVRDAENNLTSYTVDSLSRLRVETKQLGQVVSYEYDERNRLAEVINGRNNRIVRNSSAVTLDSIQYFETVSSATPDKTVTVSYDDALNVTGVKDNIIQTGDLYVYGYDAVNRVSNVTVKYLPGGDRSFVYDYDRYGNRDTVDYTDGSVLAANYTFDKRNRLISATLPAGQAFSTFEYYDNGQLKKLTYPNGVVADYSYKANGPVQDIDFSGISGSIEQLVYTYDDVRNVDTYTDTEGLYDYGYDGLNRLTTATYPSATGFAADDFSYDGVSNREDGSNPNLYDYDGNNRIAASPLQTYTFDDDGNMATRSDGAEFTHNIAGRLAEFSLPAASVTATYEYDPMGRRISKTVNGTKTWFVWDNTQLFAEYSSTGVRQKRYAYLPGIYLAVQTEDANGLYNVHGNAIGLPLRLTDSAQTIVWSATYSAFGLANVNADPDDNASSITFNQRFPGQYFDAESGFHQNYFRDYDPLTGRYVQSDPIGQLGGINTYSYAFQSPLSYLDFLGLCPIPVPKQQVVRYDFVPIRVDQNELENLLSSVCAVLKGTCFSIGPVDVYYQKIDTIQDYIEYYDGTTGESLGVRQNIGSQYTAIDQNVGPSRDGFTAVGRGIYSRREYAIGGIIIGEIGSSY